jgi:hypothetical protein
MSIVERILEVFSSYAFMAQGWNPQEEDDYQNFVDAVGNALAPAEQGERVGGFDAWFAKEYPVAPLAIVDGDRECTTLRDGLREAWQAALAQNAQGDKPVAWCAGLDATVYGFIDAKAWKEGEFTTPLYLHAERARVPTDAMLAAFVHTWNGGSEWLPSPMNLTKRQLARARKAYDAFLAAAPSQPEDAA